ncbi:7 transmembrane receptor [Necator americanus]|uniref:7 transmembrane receptor n=1 Tax=Necator americanus TaxID=51031 RepID=W2SZY3_NECAM|nr:7 transmembrane receptor [Necator americanus]ETN75213.1 7 transmembrane receptor [Necator americanus]
MDSQKKSAFCLCFAAKWNDKYTEEDGLHRYPYIFIYVSTKVQLEGVWTWNVSLCLLYVYADVFLCSASIVHMSVISLDRYLGISQPLRTRNKSKTMIIVKICLVWIITLIISCPIAVLASYDHTNILQNNSCMIFSRHYIIYGSTLTFLIPFCVMFVTYLRTTTLLNKQASILSQKANDKLNGNGLRRTMPHRKLGHVRTNSTSTAATFTSSTYKSSINGPKTSTVSYSNGYHNSVVELEAPSHIPKNASILGHKSIAKRSTINRWKSRTSSYLSNIALRVGRRNSLQAASQELANEHKATRVLAVVFICFFICWTPFFVANFIVGFCGALCTMPPWLGSVFLWLGYISSTVNPIIYTTSLPNLQTSRTMTPFPSVRDSRATTEEASDEDGTNEQRPLLPQPRITTMRKSLTTLLNTSTTSTFTKSTSMCAECRRDGMFHPSDTDDTMTSSTSSCPRHLTLFSSTFGTEKKSTT